MISLSNRGMSGAQLVFSRVLPVRRVVCGFGSDFATTQEEEAASP
jgi:hypothetical protein